ncbi:MAG: tripartite tricarboxylate transporter TctB family protein [Alphaproteobacteria bacterium]|nr:tripartite tricarboxylate transporter TctB family protein [Alphaproteobacteria bacterium]
MADGSDSADAAETSARPTRWEIVALALLLLLGIVGIVAARRHAMWDYFEPGPGLFPLATALLVAGSAALAVGVAVRARLRASGAADEGAMPSSVEDRSRLLIYAGIAILWPLAFEPMGFLLSSALALLAAFRIGERMAWLPSLLFAAGSVLAGWLLFERMLGVPLPRGLLAGIIS